jgi:NAD-dependent deacetylase
MTGLGNVEELAARIGAARRVLVLSGAGISAASGIATYRGPGGMWSDAELLAAHSASSLPASLPVVWAAKGALRAQLLLTGPNAAHQALVDLERHMVARGGELVIATQNIDGLHQRAGSTGVVELHGSVMYSRCSDRGCSLPPFYDEAVPAEGEMPMCPRCRRHPLRPAIVLFEEALPARAFRAAERAARTADVMVVVGTSGTVHPAIGLVDVAASAGAFCTLVNAEPWGHPHPSFDCQLVGPAEDVLPALVAQATAR